MAELSCTTIRLAQAMLYLFPCHTFFLCLWVCWLSFCFFPQLFKTVLLSTNAISQDQILVLACSSYETIMCNAEKPWGALSRVLSEQLNRAGYVAVDSAFTKLL